MARESKYKAFRVALSTSEGLTVGMVAGLETITAETSSGSTGKSSSMVGLSEIVGRFAVV